MYFFRVQSFKETLGAAHINFSLFAGVVVIIVMLFLGVAAPQNAHTHLQTHTYTHMVENWKGNVTD